ncbi:MAG: PQQ-binding-like beta-propeller repeat protein [Planctomycetota bacterium]|jgi:outer membrane protein assembly factor BamB
MKRKHIAIGVVCVVVVCAILIGAQMVRNAIYGVQDIAGPVGAVPEPAAAPPPPTKGPADWPCWRGLNGDGASAVTGIRKDFSGGLKKLWEMDYLCQGRQTATWSAPVVQGNRLIVTGRSSSEDLVFCLNPNNGELLWSGSYEAKADTKHGPGPRATPCIDGESVDTFGRSGDLACWYLADGELMWKRNVNDAGGKTPRWGHSSSPLVYGDKLFVQGGGSAQVVAYNKTTGELAWKARRGDAGYAAPALVTMGDKIGLLIFHGTGLACLDPDDGKEFWSVPWKTSYNVNATTPVSTGATVLITSGYGTGCQALKVSASGADVLWTSKVIAAHHSDPFILDGFIYGYSGQSNQNKGHFKCVSLDDGTEKWSTDKLGWGTTLHVDGHLLCMDNEGNLFLVKPDPQGLQVVTEFRKALGDIDHEAWTIPVVANGKLYLRYLQRLLCYALADGGNS